MQPDFIQGRTTGLMQLIQKNGWLSAVAASGALLMGGCTMDGTTSERATWDDPGSTSHATASSDAASTDPSSSHSTNPQTVGFEIQIRNAKLEEGRVHVALFDHEQAFVDRDPPIRKTRLTAENGACTWRITDLPPGQYAVAVFQDGNGNETLDKNRLGMPVEPYGFSNHDPGKLRPPPFERAVVDCRQPVNQIEIKLR